MAFTPMFRKPFTQLAGESSAAAVQTYQEKVVALSPIAYWPLTEASGTTATAVVGTNGTYARDVSTMGTGDGPIAGQTAPVFDGTNDFVNIYSAGLNTNLNRSEGSMSVWMKVSAAGVWTDGALHYLLTATTAGSNERFWIYKSTTNGQITYNLRLGGTLETVTLGSLSGTGWLHFGATWSKAADEYIAYYGGSQTGATQSSLGIDSGGALVNTACCIGSNNTTPTSPHSGYLAHAAYFASVLTPAQMATLATP